jgi:S-adenosylmethionine decarboxylase proenzyme
VDLIDCDEPNEEKIFFAAEQIADRLDLKIIASRSHSFEPQGQTSVFLLSESHMSFHTWPEHRHVAFDLFSCGGTPPHPVASEILNKIFDPREQRVNIIHRGNEV